ncbi:MAG: helix-turn-helix transcriptional regulator [Oscillospiraceae bacterium]|nr:helix-turn-helix transcriptional regulator [Oscillospiraceae bacterium]
MISNEEEILEKPYFDISGLRAQQPRHHIFSNDTGDAQVTAYQVFPGITLSYNAVHMDRFELGDAAEGRIIEIHHCLEGRIEQQFRDQFFYLMPGDLSIAIRSRTLREYTFPLHHYHGITITVNTETAPKCFSCFLKDIAVQPLEVARKLCADGRSHIIRSESYVEHIFSELYSVPDSIREGYMKIKILELFLVLSGIDPGRQEAPPTLSGLQVQVAKEAASYMARNMDRRITIGELADRFHVSQTHLKQAFKGVFGVPVYSYIRIQKMQRAALMLIHSERPILEIANECGYDNGSKFAGAFREIMGETPTEYRKAHKKDNTD